MKGLPLHWKIIIALILGMIWAIVSSYLGWSRFTIDWIAPFGTIFIKLLKLIAVPLVLVSIITGISGMTDVTKLGRMGAKTLLAYLVTTVAAISIGLLLVNLVRPGERVDQDQRMKNRVSYEMWTLDAQKPIKDGKYLLEDMTQDEREVIMQEYEAKYGSVSMEDKIESAHEQKQTSPLKFLVDMVPSNIFFSLQNNSLMLQIIFFAIFFGVTMLYVDPEYVMPLRKGIVGLNEIFLKMVDVVMKAAPLFVFALMAGTISEMAGDDPKGVLDIFYGLIWYMLTVVVGLSLMIFLVYPSIIISVVRQLTYRKFFQSIGAAQTLAFSTSSSAATLPVTMECVHDNLKVSEKVSSFVLPIGATVNMDGTSMYQAIAVVFLAQLHWVDLSLAQQLTIVLTATLASIGSAAVPSAGLVMLIIVLESVGLNPAWIAIIFPVDRILDMCRTVVNVTGDAAVSTVIAATEGEIEDR